uniref:Heat shock protein 20-1 n=1 Tax=Tytthus chinensis TaxID=981288 RepID=A0A346THP1_9HEMI|nr:heat shock protein 20-1 [Tytthus chinensis]
MVNRRAGSRTFPTGRRAFINLTAPVDGTVRNPTTVCAKHKQNYAISCDCITSCEFKNAKMALLPLLLNEIYDPRRHLDDIYDQHFGLGLRDLDLPSVNLPALRVGYLRPWRNLVQTESGVSSVKSDDKEFAVKLDVNHFKPEELKVRLENDFIIVEGKHEERSDEHGYVSRQFTRRYRLPSDVLQETLASNLSSDGVLTLQAAKKPKQTSTGREINIVRTNKPAIKEEAKKDQGKENGAK